jgi:hypothetical protein
MAVRVRVRGPRVVKDDRKVYKSKYRDALRRLNTALHRAKARDDFIGGDEHATAALSAHHAFLAELRTQHGVSQPRVAHTFPADPDAPVVSPASIHTVEVYNAALSLSRFSLLASSSALTHPMSSEETVPTPFSTLPSTTTFPTPFPTPLATTTSHVPVIAPSPSSSLGPPPSDSSGQVNAAFLAFHYTEATTFSPICPDRTRLDKVQELYRFKVHSVSEMKNRGTSSIPHAEANFQASLRTTLNTVRPELVILDYFWLQARYYITNYGMDWFILNGKVWEAFYFGFDSAAEVAADAAKGNGVRKLLARERRDARGALEGPENKVKVMILPCDIGANGSSNMAAMLMEKNLPPCVDIEEITMEDAVEFHPLVRGTIEVDQILLGAAHLKGRRHSEQAPRLAMQFPFVVIFRRGLVWRDWLSAMRTASEGV